MINSIKQSMRLLFFAVVWIPLTALYIVTFWLTVAADWLHRKLDDLCDWMLTI